MKRKFWNWINNQDESGSEMRTLFLNGEISDETWYGDEVTPKLFKDELESGSGPISVSTVPAVMYLPQPKFTTC